MKLFTWSLTLYLPADIHERLSDEELAEVAAERAAAVPWVKARTDSDDAPLWLPRGGAWPIGFDELADGFPVRLRYRKDDGKLWDIIVDDVYQHEEGVLRTGDPLDEGPSYSVDRTEAAWVAFPYSHPIEFRVR